LAPTAGSRLMLAEVRRGAGEADVERVAVDHQRGLAEAELAELRLQRLGLALGLTSRLSSTIRLPSFAFDDSAIFRPSARTFLLRRR
jgi:hypothetical protein